MTRKDWNAMTRITVKDLVEQSLGIKLAENSLTDLDTDNTDDMENDAGDAAEEAKSAIKSSTNKLNKTGSSDIQKLADNLAKNPEKLAEFLRKVSSELDTIDQLSARTRKLEKKLDEYERRDKIAAVVDNMILDGKLSVESREEKVAELMADASITPDVIQRVASKLSKTAEAIGDVIENTVSASGRTSGLLESLRPYMRSKG